MPSVSLAPLPAPAPAATATAHAHAHCPCQRPCQRPRPQLPSITVQLVPSLHILTEVVWVEILQTMVPVVTNDSGGTISYGVVRKVGQNTYKVGQLFRPKVHPELHPPTGHPVSPGNVRSLHQLAIPFRQVTSKVHSTNWPNPVPHERAELHSPPDAGDGRPPVDRTS
jgi:hypothetical protein